MDASALISVALFTLSALPFFAYPAVAVASVMTLCGSRAKETRPILHIVARLFAWGTILYPLCYVLAFSGWHKGWVGLELSWAVLPFAYLAAVAGLYHLWSRL